MAIVEELELEEDLKEMFLSDVHLSISFLRANKRNIGELRVLMVLEIC